MKEEVPTDQDEFESLLRVHHDIAQKIDKKGGSLDTYAAPHVWNLVAKILRETYPTGDNDPIFLACRATITTLAVKFAQRFSEDEGFDPISWLDKCSPDSDLYPFSELWEE